MNALLHSKTQVQIDALLERPAGSVIFQGSPGLGKATVARELAMRLNCLGGAIGDCANCRQIAAGNFPDLIWIEHGEKPTIGIEQVRGLTADLALRPFGSAGVRVAVIDSADLLTLEAQNALLKLLEEPPPHTLIILIAEHPEALLITVRSRCRAIHFVSPGTSAVEAYLTKTRGLPGPVAASLAAASAGAPGVAITLAADPAAAEALASLAGDAAKAQSQSLFERLLMAARLAATGVDLERFGEALHRAVISRLENNELDPRGASIRLNALERFRLQLRAKVSPRVALERLMLELG